MTAQIIRGRLPLAKAQVLETAALVPATRTTKSNLTERLYIELSALLIDREIAKFSRGEQVALVSFANVAKLASNACMCLYRLASRRVCSAPVPALVRSEVGAACRPATNDRGPCMSTPRSSDIDRFLAAGSKCCAWYAA
jgi:hypothetical protein